MLPAATVLHEGVRGQAGQIRRSELLAYVPDPGRGGPLRSRCLTFARGGPVGGGRVGGEGAVGGDVGEDLVDEG